MRTQIQEEGTWALPQMGKLQCYTTRRSYGVGDTLAIFGKYYLL